MIISVLEMINSVVKMIISVSRIGSDQDSDRQTLPPLRRAPETAENTGFSHGGTWRVPSPFQIGRARQNTAFR